MVKTRKKKLKKILLLTLPAAAVWAGLITGACLSKNAMKKSADAKYEYQDNLINKYTTSQEYQEELEAYKNALQVSLDNGIISKQEYDRMIEKKQSDETVLNEIAIDPNYIAEYQVLKEKKHALNMTTLPFVLFTTGSVLLPIAYPIAYQVGIELNRQKREREKYNKNFESLTKEKCIEK